MTADRRLSFCILVTVLVAAPVVLCAEETDAIPAEFPRLLTALDGEEFAEREAAEQKLIELGDAIQPALAEALQKGGSEELTSRLQRVSERIAAEKEVRPVLQPERRDVVLAAPNADKAAQALGEAFGVRTIASNQIKARDIDLKLTNVTWAEALVALAKAFGEPVAVQAQPDCVVINSFTQKEVWCGLVVIEGALLQLQRQTPTSRRDVIHFNAQFVAPARAVTAEVRRVWRVEPDGSRSSIRAPNDWIDASSFRIESDALNGVKDQTIPLELEVALSIPVRRGVIALKPPEPGGDLRIEPARGRSLSVSYTVENGKHVVNCREEIRGSEARDRSGTLRCLAEDGTELARDIHTHSSRSSNDSASNERKGEFAKPVGKIQYSFLRSTREELRTVRIDVPVVAE